MVREELHDKGAALVKDVPQGGVALVGVPRGLGCSRRPTTSRRVHLILVHSILTHCITEEGKVGGKFRLDNIITDSKLCLHALQLLCPTLCMVIASIQSHLTLL